MADNESITAYAIKGEGGIWLTAHPATFGHAPCHMPILFPDARKAEQARRMIPEKTYTCIVVIDWNVAETIGQIVIK